MSDTSFPVLHMGEGLQSKMAAHVLAMPETCQRSEKNAAEESC